MTRVTLSLDEARELAMRCLQANWCQLDHIERRKTVYRTATRVAVGFKCETAAASSRCPSLQESVRNLDLDVNERDQQR